MEAPAVQLETHHRITNIARPIRQRRLLSLSPRDQNPRLGPSQKSGSCAWYALVAACIMPSHAPPSPSKAGIKRQRLSSFDHASPRNGGGASPTGLLGAEARPHAAAPKPGQSSNFRNVSACNRCRLRKNRCDQKLPSCASCAKAGVACVGYDPITKKEIPRSYVFYLETRLEQLENLLRLHNISFPPAETLEQCSRPPTESAEATHAVFSAPSDAMAANQSVAKAHSRASETLKDKEAGDGPAMLSIVSPSRPRSLASALGVSFARVVYAAVQYSRSDHSASRERFNPRQGHGSGTSMRDSFFGLHTKPAIQLAPFPDKDMGLRLVTLYFEHANPQIPILHREQFMQVFRQAYEKPAKELLARELYLLNIVFAIGCGVIVGEPVKTEASADAKVAAPQAKDQRRPEEYHASAIMHLESCLSLSGGGLEVLQAVLLLANFALLRPVPPGLWYITGVAVRLAVDLGLHHEDGSDMEESGQVEEPSRREGTGRNGTSSHLDNGFQDRGRKLWVRDMRRRLWWCTYSLDRLVSTCVGRPFGVSDEVITTELPSLLDDNCITPAGFPDRPDGEQRPSYKHVGHHYFRLRMLQSEMLQVLQYNEAEIARASNSRGKQYPEMRTRRSSPYLAPFDSFKNWRIDIDRRLYQWKASAPTRQETGVAFSTEFLELNYWQAIIMLYRQSLSIPVMFEGEYDPSNEVNSPTAYTAELREDEDQIYLKVAEAGQKIVRIYRQLHLSGLVSYTYLSTHHLFMAGISYLYAIWHSQVVRSWLSMDEVDFTVLAARSVFSDMMDKCPPAKTCREVFDRTAKTTIKMATSGGGFGSATQEQHRSSMEKRTMTGWVSAHDGAASAPQLQSPGDSHGDHKPDQVSFRFEMSVSDRLASPGRSEAERDGRTPPPPPPPRATARLEGDVVIASQSCGGRETVLSHHGSTSEVHALSAQSAGLTGRSRGRRVEEPSATFTSQQLQQQLQQFGTQASAVNYDEGQTLEFLQSIGPTGEGDLHSLDQTQFDLGFGKTWENMHNDYGEGQQMNPFDTFFFGGNISNMGHGAGSSSSSNGSGVGL